MGAGVNQLSWPLGGRHDSENDLRLGPVAPAERELTADEFGVRAAARQQCGMVSVLDQMVEKFGAGSFQQRHIPDVNCQGRKSKYKAASRP